MISFIFRTNYFSRMAENFLESIRRHISLKGSIREMVSEMIEVSQKSFDNG